MIAKISNVIFQAVAVAIIVAIPTIWLLYPLDHLVNDTWHRNVVVLAVVFGSVVFLCSVMFLAKEYKELMKGIRPFAAANPKFYFILVVVLPFALGLISKHLHRVNSVK